MTLELYYYTELGAVIDRNKDTRCIAICIAIQVFHIAIYCNTLFGVSLHPYNTVTPPAVNDGSICNKNHNLMSRFICLFQPCPESVPHKVAVQNRKVLLSSAESREGLAKQVETLCRPTHMTATKCIASSHFCSLLITSWVKVFRIIPELRILRLESQPQNAEIGQL